MLSLKVPSMGAVIVRCYILCIEAVLSVCMFCRVPNRTADCFGRYDIYVKTVLLISFNALTCIHEVLGMLSSRSQCLPLNMTIHTAIRTGLFVVGTGVLN